MNKKTYVLILTAAILTIGSSSAFAQNTNGPDFGNRQRPNMGHHMEQRAEKLGQKLNLSKEQEQQAAKIREESRSKMKPLIDQMKTERDKFKSMKANNASQADLDQQKAKMKSLMLQIKTVHQQNLANFEQILTPAQKTQFQTLKKERMEKFKQKRKDFKGKSFGQEDGFSQR